MKAVCVIPARYASTRFPGKLLAADTGSPLLKHVHDRAVAAKRIDRVIIATDDARISAAVEAFGGEPIMTRSDHENGTSRIAEAVESLARDYDAVVNVQGDEPELDPALIDLAVEALEGDPQCAAATIASPIQDDAEARDPNVVKVVCDRRGRALLFSRALIPHDRDGGGGVQHLRHVGLYVYRRDFLKTYASLEPTPLEAAEKLEQLRILEHGYSITVAVAASAHAGIDTPQQYRDFVARFRGRESGRS